ncbi:hypothetical protein Sbs19_22190 [Sphingobium sp. BS19]|nr:hypothetical protein Sbs19_22190 [Sphingobium sp. BS19]
MPKFPSSAFAACASLTPADAMRRIAKRKSRLPLVCGMGLSAMAGADDGVDSEAGREGIWDMIGVSCSGSTHDID